MTHEEQVLINGKSFLYKAKSPFVPSGVSVLGALEYRGSDDKVRCHECGEWFSSLGNHVLSAHGIRSKDYKSKHGLRAKAALCGVRVSNAAKEKGSVLKLVMSSVKRMEYLKRAVEVAALRNAERRKSGTSKMNMEYRNERALCPAQILERLRDLRARLGRTPTLDEIQNNGMSPESVCAAFSAKNTTEVMGLIQFLPNGAGANGHIGKEHKNYTPQLLVEMLRDFYVKWDRLPGGADVGRGMIPSPGVFAYHFGSMGNAYEAAGFSRKAPNRGNRKHIKESLLGSLSSFYAAHGRFPRKSEWGKCGLANYYAYRHNFGSLASAYSAVLSLVNHPGSAGINSGDVSINLVVADHNRPGEFLRAESGT